MGAKRRPDPRGNLLKKLRPFRFFGMDPGGEMDRVPAALFKQEIPKSDAAPEPEKQFFAVRLARVGRDHSQMVQGLGQGACLRVFRTELMEVGNNHTFTWLIPAGETLVGR